ncbi:MAG: hypothetical protein K2Y01_08890 [Rhabdochlamydiaceae bacterium]|nr:hypothetical protein [Rhabdochlamydiaceae bacterium]
MNDKINKKKLIKAKKLSDELSPGPIWLESFLNPVVTYKKTQDIQTYSMKYIYTALDGTNSVFVKDCTVPSMYTITAISGGSKREYKTGSTIPSGTKFEGKSNVVLFY